MLVLSLMLQIRSSGADLSVLSLPQMQRAGGKGCVTHVSADCLFLC